MIYATLVYADDYFATRLHTDAWDELDPVDRTKALTMATRDIDNLTYTGCKADPLQTLEFPREGQVDVPDEVRIACCEIALKYAEGCDPEQEFEAACSTSQKYAGVSVNYDRSTIAAHVSAYILSLKAWNLIKPFLRENRDIRSSRIS